MIHLSKEESRVLGVLVEKAYTVPGTYPMTVNAIVSGCNQKNNREPLVEYDEARVLDALSGLREKQLAMIVDMSGSRVLKYRHLAREALHVEAPQLAVIAELLLRGPQTLGELRGRASRMQHFETLEAVAHTLDSLMNLPEPLVRRVAPLPGTRAERFAQLLCPELHPVDAATAPVREPSMPDALTIAQDPALLERVEKLETDVAELRRTVEQLKSLLS